jgi:hypothetical protein
MLTRITTVLAVALLVTSCAEDRATDIPRVEDKSFAITPAQVAVETGILAGQLSDLAVSERINTDTNEVIYPPQLKGRLKLRNTAEDQSVRVIEGSVKYLDASGQVIPLAKGRSDTTFQFYSYTQERLDPGEELSHQIDIPFPATALDGTALAELRLDITYIPDPYRVETVKLPVTLTSRN